MPLSREFLLARGFCCNLGCVNCPYKEKEMTYKPIPKHTTKIWLDCWSCGDCCDAYYVSIYSNQGKLWESDWGNLNRCDDGFKEEIDEIRKETIAACEHYGIELIDIEEDCIYNWEGERIL